MGSFSIRPDRMDGSLDRHFAVKDRISCIHRFSLTLVTVVSAELGKSQEPVFYPDLPKGCRDQTLEPSSIPFPRPLAENWSQSGAARREIIAHMEVCGIACWPPESCLKPKWFPKLLQQEA